ncbi:MAG TPA: oxalate/formate MFS antiporter [Chthoniobacterales bacterium]|nr:oxalate/formate MFS antiporter [Chthoniobacterales bacterium]
MATDPLPLPRQQLKTSRWLQLLFGLICMMAISSPQYVWTLFTGPFTTRLGATLAQVQVTISILIVLQTFLSPFQGYLVDLFGPRTLLSIGAIFAGASWILAATVKSTLGLYLTYGLLGGIGTGIIYVGVVGLMVGWFPDKKGFACGVVAAGYGMGAILTTFPISQSLAAIGHPATLVMFGLFFGTIGLLAAQGIKRPPTKTQSGHPGSIETLAGVSPLIMLRSPVFWVLFVMMSMMSSSGLMVITQMAAFAKDFGVANTVVFGTAALPLALTIDRFTNGLTRPFFGWLSDRIGREQTMFLAFGLEGLAMLLWLATRQHALLFVLLSGFVFFGWGEIFSLFPSTLTDTFGERHATTNYGFLYMAQGIGSIIGAPLAAWLHEATGDWITVFAAMITMDFLAAIMAITVLRPLRKSRASMYTTTTSPATAALPV